MNRKYPLYARALIKGVGGADNILAFSKGTALIRLILKDRSLADDSEISSIECVLSIIKKNGEYRIITSSDADRLYSALSLLLPSAARKGDLSFSEGDGSRGSENPFIKFLNYVSGCMSPLIPAMLGAGMIKVTLVLLLSFGIIDKESGTYTVIFAVGDAFFYFIPIMLSMSVARRVGTSIPTAMLVAGILIHPTIIELLANGDASFFGLRIYRASYPYSVFPILIMVPIMKYIEIFADKISPYTVKALARPFITVLISAPIALLLVGPIGAAAGDVLALVIEYVYSSAGWLAVALLAFAMPFIVMTGMNYALLPIALSGITSLGADPILTAAIFSSNLAQGGAALAVALRSGNKHTRQVAGSSALSAILAGVTEPAFYGVNMKYKTPLISASVAAAAAGIFAGVKKLSAYTIGGSYSAISLASMISESNPENFTNGLFTFAIALLLSFSLTVIFFNERKAESLSLAPDIASEKKLYQPYSCDGSFNESGCPSPSVNKQQGKKSSSRSENKLETPEKPTFTSVYSPLGGVLIPLSDVGDEVFASEILGKGCAIVPDDGRVYAPFDGTIKTLPDTKHAICIRSYDGCELLIHVGKDTVSLGGKYFKAFCSEGDSVKLGDLLLVFELEKLEREGYDTATPVIVINHESYKDFSPITKLSISSSEMLFTLEEKPSPEKSEKSM